MCELVIEKEAKDAEVAWKIAVWLGRRIGVRTCSVLVFSICFSLLYCCVINVCCGMLLKLQDMYKHAATIIRDQSKSRPSSVNIARQTVAKARISNLVSHAGKMLHFTEHAAFGDVVLPPLLAGKVCQSCQHLPTCYYFIIVYTKV